MVVVLMLVKIDLIDPPVEVTVTPHPETYPLQDKASFDTICPDVAIELRSASDTLKGLQGKMEEYIENGVLLGWLIDSRSETLRERKNRTVYIYRPDRDLEILENPDRVCGDRSLPGFSLPMAKIW